MPGFNQSGPEGQGPATGKKRGMCQRTDYSTFSGVGSGRGRGRGVGMGQGTAQGANMGRGQTPAFQNSGSGSDLESLKSQYESTRQMLEELQKKIEAMEARQK